MVLEDFRSAAQRDKKADENLNRLLDDVSPVRRYVVMDDTDSGDKSVQFSTFNKIIHEMVRKLEEVIYAASSSSKPFSTLSQVFDEQMDVLFGSVNGNDFHISTTSRTVQMRLEKTIRRVRRSPSFENLGGFSSVLSHLYHGTKWTEINNTNRPGMSLNSPRRSAD